MNEKQPDPKQPQLFNLICPYCEVDPIRIHCRDALFPNGVVALVVACMDCRKVLSASFQARQLQRRLATLTFA
jgi:hypothetical protein